MLHRTFRSCAQVLVLLIAPAAFGDFVEVRFEIIRGAPEGTRTCRAMARFDDPGDKLLGAGGSLEAALRWKATDAGGLVNFDEDVAGSVDADLPFHETWEYDSWLAVGEVGQVTQDVIFSPGFTLCGTSSGQQLRGCSAFSRRNLGWFVQPAERTVGQMDPDGDPDAGWRVPIAQFTTDDAGSMVFCGHIFWIDPEGEGSITSPFEAACPDDLTMDANRTTRHIAILPLPDGGEGWDITGLVTTVAVGRDAEAELGDVVRIGAGRVVIEEHVGDIFWFSRDLCFGFYCVDDVCTEEAELTRPFTAFTPFIHPEDPVTVTVSPGEGTYHDTQEDDNIITLPFRGPRYWDRRIRGLDVTPSAGAGSTYDVTVVADLIVEYDTRLDVAFDVQLFAEDGVMIASSAGTVDHVIAFTPCADVCDGVCALNDLGDTVGTCVDVPDQPVDCACYLEPRPVVFRDLALSPGQTVTAIIDAAPFAAPELAAMAGDESMSVVVPAGCPADIDDSGAVDFGDVLLLLSAWGDRPREGGCDCPGELTGDCTVDFRDLLALLAAWGPCP